jgi:predicted SprT family Zn-dependent metalloprotease
MNGKQAAKRAGEKYGTREPFVIAEKAGVQIIYESWYPTTIGEFERDEKTIRVNRRALENNKNAADLEQIIVAHELGHFFATELKLDGSEEERFAREFAAELLKKMNKSYSKA